MNQSNAAMMDWVPVPAAGTMAESIDGELLLYRPSDTRAIYLNPTATIIWSLCDGHRSAREIINLIGDAYPDTKATLTSEVLTTLQHLRDSGAFDASQ